MAKKVQTAVEKPWEGIMTKENYDRYSKGMTAKEKKELDYGLAIGDTNLLMSLGALGLYEPTRNRGGARGRKNGAKK